MKKLLYSSLVGIVGLLASCNGTSEPSDEVITDTISVDTIDTTLVDSSLFMDDSGYVDELLETNNIIEATYGVQWDFCDCVVKNDSINTALEKAGEDADYDAILNRMEVIDQHCKTLLTAPNTTPDEREAHERKVRKCLKNAK